MLFSIVHFLIKLAVATDKNQSMPMTSQETSRLVNYPFILKCSFYVLCFQKLNSFSSNKLADAMDLENMAEEFISINNKMATVNETMNFLKQRVQTVYQHLAIPWKDESEVINENDSWTLQQERFIQLANSGKCTHVIFILTMYLYRLRRR